MFKVQRWWLHLKAENLMNPATVEVFDEDAC